MKKMLGVAILLVAAAGCTSPEPPAREPEKVQAIKFVPQEAETGSGERAGR